MSDNLEIDPEEMRRLGYAAVDRIVAEFRRQDAGPAWSMISREDGEALLREPLPETGTPLDALMERVDRDVFGHRARVAHRRFFAFVPGSPTYVSMLGDILTAGFNPFVGTWLGGSGPSMLELVVMDWFREMVGLPEGAGGLLTSGGSAATLIALTAAREAKLGSDASGGVLYAADQTHACVERAAKIAAIPHYRKITADAGFRMDMAALEAAVTRDRAAGLRPFAVTANAGTTNTGSVDPLSAIADFCRRENLWLHIDAAYGGFATLTDRGREALRGIDRGDSWVLDPHKWLYQGIECGSVMVARPEDLRAAFRVRPDYMLDVDRGGERVNFADYGYQLSRTSRAVKVWLSLKHHGVAEFRKVVDRMLSLAVFAEERLRHCGDFEILSPARLGIVCFRLTRPGLSEAVLEEWNDAAQAAVNDSGYAFLSSTRLAGRYTLRMCIMARTTEEADVAGVIERLREEGARLAPR